MIVNRIDLKIAFDLCVLSIAKEIFCVFIESILFFALICIYLCIDLYIY